jgi:hypothetical protein
MRNFVTGWGDVSAAAAVYTLALVFSADDLSAMDPGKVQEITIIFGGSLFYILVRLIWKAIQRFLKKQELENQ